MSALLAVAFFFLSGYYAWATVIVWTFLVLPLVLRSGRQARTVGERWPSGPLLRAWAAAVLLSLVAGIVPSFLTVNPGTGWIGILLAVSSWVAVILTALVVGRVTYERSRPGARAA